MNRETKTRKVLASGLTLLVVASILTTLVPVAIQPASAQTPINSCTTISTSGEYELTQDITNDANTTCIDIQVDDVVFDGNGYTVDGVDTGGTQGVQSVSQTNVTVENLTVTDWDNGVNINSNTNDTIANVVANSNTNVGIDVGGSSENTTLTNVTATNNTNIGIFLSSDNTTVTNSTANGNVQGFRITIADNTLLTNTTANGNSLDGFLSFPPKMPV